jgi:hypothetical protein
MKHALGLVPLFLGLAQLSWGQTKDRTSVVSVGETAPAFSTNTYAVLGATSQQEALVRSQIQTMQPAILPLRVVFVPHWKYVDNTRVFHLHVPTGYTSALFTHLPSRTVFVDADRYFDESLGYWLAHELGHLVTNSADEHEADKATREFRRRLERLAQQRPTSKQLGGSG